MVSKKIYLILFQLFFTFPFLQGQQLMNYEKAWTHIEDLINKKGLTETALKEVNQLFETAKKEKNASQQIKALVYKVHLRQIKEEDADLKTIKELEKEIETAVEPVKSILYNLAAESYWNYFQNNRWQIYDRTNTGNMVNPDPETWTRFDFHLKITQLFQLSIAQEILLKHTSLEQFEAILSKGNMRHLRPTLFDLLSHRALRYFENDENNPVQPEKAFEIGSIPFYGSAKEFIKLTPQTTDTISLQYQAFVLYQKLITFHLNDENPLALMDIDLLRLQFIHRYSTLEDKSEYYRSALLQFINLYQRSPLTAQAAYLLGKEYAEFAHTYDFKKHKVDDGQNPRWYFKKAIDLCKPYTELKEESEGISNCYNLIRQINEKTIRITTEKVNLPNKPFRALVSYRNIEKAFFRIIPVTQSFYNDFVQRSWDDSIWRTLKDQSAHMQLSFELPASEDKQLHATEIRIPALPTGSYILLASSNERFDVNENLLALHFFHSSALAWMHNKNHYYVVNRETGQPIKNAQAIFWTHRYDYNINRFVATQNEKYTTDGNGYFKAQEQQSNMYFDRTLEIRSGIDQLHLDERIYSYTYTGNESTENEELKKRVFLFTDRSIYRPGQTVFFKGIVITQNNKTGKSGILPAFKTNIHLLNTDHTRTDSIEVITNEFGSFTGQFQIPTGKLNGEFSIEESITGTTTGFSVEEYKRPQFFIEYAPIKKTYRVYDTIQVTGIAKAFAGNTITDAKVKYRVVREARLPYPWLCRIWGWPETKQQEITNGTTATQPDGSFCINFTATPDKQIRKELNPFFEYKVIVDITDLNGETRTAETTISSGYQSLQLKVSIPESIQSTINNFNQLIVRTENLMGQHVAWPVTVSMHRIQAPDRLIRDRYWDEPDQFIINEETYKKDFPYDLYHWELEQDTWKRIGFIATISDTTREDGRFSFPIVKNSKEKKKISPGWYVVDVVTRDKDGQELKEKIYIELKDDASDRTTAPGYIWKFPEEIIAEPGKLATIQFGSSANDVFIVQQHEKNESVQPVFHRISNEHKSIRIPITETERGGTGYSFSFIKHNRFFSITRTIHVPYSNKELVITHETFRDKTQPGSKEQWKVKISGKNGDRVAAELLTTLYDASLDQFRIHSWNKPDIYPLYGIKNEWTAGGFNKIESLNKAWYKTQWKGFDKRYDELIGIMSFSHSFLLKRGRMDAVSMMPNASNLEDVQLQEKSSPDSSVVQTDQKRPEAQKRKRDDWGDIQVRSNFNETAFFHPSLRTDSTGTVEINLIMPEALTQWKWLLLAHTKDLSFGWSEKKIVTQKKLMVQSFAPRFLREGDLFEFTAKITNLSDDRINGQSALFLFRNSSGISVDSLFQNNNPVCDFSLEPGRSTVVKFKTHIPAHFPELLTYRIMAKGAPEKGMTVAVSDGEEALLPVLSNRILVTESLPINSRKDGTTNFTFSKLLNNTSNTLTHHSITIEYTSNPVWYAIQALPYMIERPYVCAEQIWNQFYANALASHITNKLPRIKTYFEQWKHFDSTILKSNLEKNEELKSILLQETPWILEAKNESQQKKHIALLFDLVRLSMELNKTIEYLKNMQAPNGGFVWLKGGPDDRYMTQYIVTGIGHLIKLQALPEQHKQEIYAILEKAIPYLDQQILKDYNELVKIKANLKQNQISQIQIQYLYMRSFFKSIPQTAGTQKAYQYYYGQARKHWLKNSRYMQGMIALFLTRNGDFKTSRSIVRSLKENALRNDEMGMYWKEFNTGYYWHEAPIEAQALMIEVFQEIAKDEEVISDLKTWLLKQKQTQNWKSTKATAEACYALLLQGISWIENEPIAEIKLGDRNFSSQTEQTTPGLGYFKRTIEGNEVKPQNGKIQLTVQGSRNMPTWGGIYWQYFENLDQITASVTSLQLKKKYFLEQNTINGPILIPITDTTRLHVGDKIKVRIELKTDRQLEYVHMKDLRPACMEPSNTISGYKWQGGIGYYESTRDAATDFFIDRLNRGSYVFEYPLYVTHKGSYSSGVTNIQCLYAPEFSAHSEGIRIVVE